MNTTTLILNPIQVLILQHLANGRTVSEAAQIIRISHQAAINHLQKARQKNGLQTTYRLLLLAFDDGSIKKAS